MPDPVDIAGKEESAPPPYQFALQAMQPSRNRDKEEESKDQFHFATIAGQDTRMISTTSESCPSLYPMRRPRKIKL
ncbi:MAG: hypothetical protein KDA65_13455 [Planctomycetaceae bacterium]|nr:hypothetical protein [Planctomycetaceae bacterium]